MKQEENDTQYNRRYHLQRALKPLLHIDSHKMRIDIPEGMELGKTDQKRVDALVNDYGYVIQSVIPIASFEKVMLSGSMAIQGNDIRFREDKFFGHKPGTKILKIGKGVDSMENRLEAIKLPVNNVDSFKLPVTYRGSVFIENRKYYALQLDPTSVKNRDLDFYMLYEIAGKEIIRLVYRKDGSYHYTRFYKPEFKLQKPERRKPGKQNKLNL